MDEFWLVVAADARRRWANAGELLQHRHHVLCSAVPAHPDGHAETAVLVDHIDELEPPAIGGRVEPEVPDPDLVWALGLVTPHRPVNRGCPFLLTGGWPLQALLAPEAVHPLVVHGPAFPLQYAVGIRRPQRMCSAAIFRRRPRSFPSSMETTFFGYRWCCGVGTPPGRSSAGMAGNDPAGPQWPAGEDPGSEVSLGRIIEHRLVERCFCQMPVEPPVLLLHLGELFGLFCPHGSVELSSAVLGGSETSRTRQAFATVWP